MPDVDSLVSANRVGRYLGLKAVLNSGNETLSKTGLAVFAARLCAREGVYAALSPTADDLSDFTLNSTFSGECLNCSVLINGSADGSIPGNPLYECPGGPRLYSVKGHWNLYTRIPPYECFPPDRCVGGRQRCAKGNTGFFCGSCRKGYFLEEGLCKSCDDTAELTWGFLFFAEFFFIVVYMIAVVLVPNVTLNNVVGALVSIQIIHVVGSKLSPELPGYVQQAFRYTALVNLDLQFVKYASCGRVKGIDADARFRFYFFSNIWAVAGIVVLLMLISKLPAVRRRHPGRVYRSITINCMLFYLVLTTRALEALYCIKIGDEYYLQADMGVRCYRGRHVLVTYVALGLLLFYSIGWPIIVWRSIRRWKEKDLLDNAGIKYRYGFLYEPYKRTTIFFSVSYYFVATTLAVSGTVLNRHALAKFIVQLTVLITFLMRVIVRRPMRLWWRNVSWAMAILISAFGSVLNLLEAVGVTLDGNLSRYFALAFLGAAGVLVFFYAVSIFFGLSRALAIVVCFCCCDKRIQRNLDEYEEGKLRAGSELKLVGKAKKKHNNDNNA
eukprot:TRINITY_DN65566_c4_g2_i1.p1 TRINITY_DN65566_c4_g2~~TRINITY_DN65566_c4_g2_i1.p1  ORF type:complete len:555 (-),score=259.80 TRINITY_DN65566_c4_g2_i1:66-1730(-)